jgi:hypothetical protein
MNNTVNVLSNYRCQLDAVLYSAYATGQPLHTSYNTCITLPNISKYIQQKLDLNLVYMLLMFKLPIFVKQTKHRHIRIIVHMILCIL